MKRLILILAFIVCVAESVSGQVTTKEVVRVTADITNQTTCVTGRIYYNETSLVNWERNNAGLCKPITSGGTPGNVVGPASATDNAAVRFNLTTGKIVQNSGVIIDDSNNVSGFPSLTSTSANPADAGVLRLGNAECVAWEKFVAGADWTLCLNASDELETNANMRALSFIGPLTGNVTGNISGSSGSTTGNAATVTTNANSTGDVTSVGNATTLATVNGNVGTFGSATESSQVTVNAKGLVTAAANVTVTPAVGSITGLGTNVATALGVAIGSAGAPVLLNGVGGTPSSLTGTNISGTAAGLTSGTTSLNANLSGVVVSSGSNVTTPGKADVMQSSEFGADAGANDTYVVPLTPALTSYVVGTKLRFFANTANTGAASVNFNSLGALAIKVLQGTADPANGDIKAGAWVDCTIKVGSICEMTSTLGNEASASPGGSDTHVQFNDSSAFGGVAQFTFTKPGVSATGAVVLSGTPLSATSGIGAAASDILTVTGAAGQASSSNGSEESGGRGSDISITSGAGGNQTGTASDSNAGTGGSFDLISGDGGAVTHATGTASGGSAGGFNIAAGTGGASAGNGQAGLGGPADIRGGSGGVASKASTSSGGGGEATLRGGTGGEKTNAGTSGNGGNVNINAGPAGSASGGGTAGTNGSVNIGLSNTLVVNLGPTVIGSGSTPILKHFSATATLNFANQVGVGCENLTITVTGAVVGDTVAIGIPNNSIVTNGVFYGWVSATDTVSIKFCAVISGDPASGTFRADVWQH